MDLFNENGKPIYKHLNKPPIRFLGVFSLIEIIILMALLATLIILVGVWEGPLIVFVLGIISRKTILKLKNEYGDKWIKEVHAVFFLTKIIEDKVGVWKIIKLKGSERKRNKRSY